MSKAKERIDESELSDLLCCPHCNGNAELKSKNERVGYDEYMRYIDLFYVACSECGARTADFRKKTFAETTEYTVQDFRENPALRAKVEDEYTIYCKQLEQETISAWNKRAS